MNQEDKQATQDENDFEKILEFSMLEKPQLVERIMDLEELCRKLIIVNSKLESMLREKLLK